MEISAEMLRMLATSREKQASDIHIVAGLPPLFRINGEIILDNYPPFSREDTKRLSYSLLNEEQKVSFEKDWKVCCSIYEEKLGRFRVSIYLHAGNPELSIRPVIGEIKTREELRLPVQIEDLCRISEGMVLVTGPTGSGKTTTLNFMIDLINSERRCKIIAIEDPVEYVHKRKKAIIVQQELYTDVKSFPSALFHVLRQDPDVICIGEMRDLETTSTALVAAETGHLVIATCHTPNTVQTVERIVSIFPENQQPQVYTQLSNCLKGIIAQRLLISSDKSHRVLATELLLNNPASKKHIREQELHQLANDIQLGKKQGMYSLDSSLIKLYQSGEITYETALNNAYDPEAVKIKLKEEKSGN